MKKIKLLYLEFQNKEKKIKKHIKITQTKSFYILLNISNVKLIVLDFPLWINC